MLTFTFNCGPLPSLPHPEIIVIFFKNTDVHSYTLSWVFFFVFCVLCSKPMHVESQLPLSLKLTDYAIKTHYSPGSHPMHTLHASEDQWMGSQAFQGKKEEDVKDKGRSVSQRGRKLGKDCFRDCGASSPMIGRQHGR